MIKTVNDRVLVKVDEAPKETKGGLIIPEVAREGVVEMVTGTVIEVSDGILNLDGTWRKHDVKKGDRVLVRKFGGTDIRIDGEDYEVFREADIYATVE